MRSFGITSTGPPVRHPAANGVHGSRMWGDSLGAAAVVLIGIGALGFVLIVLPWVISF